MGTLQGPHSRGRKSVSDVGALDTGASVVGPTEQTSALIAVAEVITCMPVKSPKRA